MASHLEILVEIDRPEDELREVLGRAWQEVERLEEMLSSHRPTSEVARVNRDAHDAPVPVSEELFGVLAEAATIHGETGGAFDITVGPLVRCWGFFERQGHIPARNELHTARERIGQHLVDLDEARRTVRFRQAGTEINLGAIGKGYVVDRVADHLRGAGVRCALVQSGGSSVVGVGAPPDSAEGWRIGVRPGGPESERVGVVVLNDSAFGTSGDFEQSFEEGGRRYGHVLDPRTGEPARGLRASCGLCDRAARADALSTAFLVMGTEETEAFCAKHHQSAILMWEDEQGTLAVRQCGSPIMAPAPPEGPCA